jgi:hypothetical protein
MVVELFFERLFLPLKKSGNEQRDPKFFASPVRAFRLGSEGHAQKIVEIKN